jgi:hypothetical protein
VIILSVVPVALFGAGNSNYPNRQQNDPEPNTYNANNTEAKLFFTGGAHFLDMSEMNSAISATSFPALPQEYATLGFTYQTITSRFINETDFEWLLKRTAMNDIYHSSYWAFYFTSNAGYLIIQSKHVDLFPMFGLGYGRQNISLVEYTSSAFANYLNSTPINLRLESSSFCSTSDSGSISRSATEKPRPSVSCWAFAADISTRRP